MGPLLPDEGSRGARVARRAKGIAIEVVGFLIVTALLPVLMACAAIVDLVLWLRSRKPWMAVRLVAMLWWFLLGELRGLLTLFAIGIASAGRDTPRRRRAVFRLRHSWAAAHLAGIRRIFRMKLDVQGLEDAGSGPIVMLIRHASIVDNMLPDGIVGREHGIGLRYVIKRELQMIPNIDIGGRWVPTHFVLRASGDTAAELVNLRKLAIDLGPDDGILIYPEGTRHTDEKLARAQQLIAERQPEIAHLAARLRHLLPPRLGGTLAMLQDARGADVVVCGHVGLDGFEYISDIWRGGLVGTTVRVRFWRHPAADVPAERDALIAWLYDRWQELDDWVGEVKNPRTRP